MLFVELVVQGLVYGCMYAMMAVGLTLVYGLLRILHIAHAGVFALGAYMTVTVANATGSLALGFLVATVVSAVAGIAIYRLAYQPILHHAAFVPMVVSIGLFIVMQEGFRLVFGAYGIAFDNNPWYVAHVNLLGINLTYVEVAMVVMSVVLLVGFGLFAGLTRAGIGWRATVTDPQMATSFGKLFVPCVVGNHGRSTKKMQMKERVFTSHEWNVYCGVARHFRRSKHVQFSIPETADCAFNIFGHRYLLTHGDSLGTKGGDGIIGALGPIMRGTLKTHRSEAQIGRDFDTLLIGHWHQYITLPGLIVNNSLKGYDEFAHLVLRAPYSRPSQALWFTHPEHGLTAHWQVYLEKQLAPLAEEKPWVSWQDFADTRREAA